VLFSALLLCAPRAAADERAKAIFDEASAAFEAGSFTEAATKFEEADQRSPRGPTAFNAGLAWEAAGEPARAADAYARALRRGDLDPDRYGKAQARLTALREELGVLDIVAPADATVSVAHARGARTPILIHVAPGEHELRLSTKETRRVRVAAGETLRVVFEKARAKAKTPPKLPPKLPPKPREDSETNLTGPVIGGIALGTAAVLTGVAIYLGVTALSVNDEFEAGGFHDQELHDRAVTLRTWTNVTWAGAGAFALAGTLTLALSLTDSSGR